MKYEVEIDGKVYKGTDVIVKALDQKFNNAMNSWVSGYLYFHFNDVGLVTDFVPYKAEDLQERLSDALPSSWVTYEDIKDSLN